MFITPFILLHSVSEVWPCVFLEFFSSERQSARESESFSKLCSLLTYPCAAYELLLFRPSLHFSHKLAPSVGPFPVRNMHIAGLREPGHRFSGTAPGSGTKAGEADTRTHERTTGERRLMSHTHSLLTSHSVVVDRHCARLMRSMTSVLAEISRCHRCEGLGEVARKRSPRPQSFDLRSFFSSRDFPYSAFSLAS